MYDGSTVGHGRFIAGGISGILLQAACAAKRPPCHASRSRREAGNYSQSGQKGKESLASRRQRRVFRAAFSGNCHPIGRQAQGSRFPPRKLPCPSSERRSCGQMQKSIITKAEGSTAAETSAHAAMRAAVVSATAGSAVSVWCSVTTEIRRPVGSPTANPEVHLASTRC
jgi:hypothetical protein